MILTKLGLTPDPLVRTIFSLFLRVEESVVGVFMSYIFAPIVIGSIAGIFASGLFVSTGVDSKGD